MQAVKPTDELTDLDFMILTKDQVLNGRNMKKGDIVLIDAESVRKVDEIASEFLKIGVDYKKSPEERIQEHMDFFKNSMKGE
jgi:hypothetical protein